MTGQHHKNQQISCKINRLRSIKRAMNRTCALWGQQRARPVEKAHGLPIGILLDHGQVGVQADAHCGIKGHLEGCAVVLGPDHGPQLFAVHSLLHLLEEPLEGLPVGVCFELQPAQHAPLLRKKQVMTNITVWKVSLSVTVLTFCLQTSSGAQESPDLCMQVCSFLLT